jgi:hypothetical protein
VPDWKRGSLAPWIRFTTSSRSASNGWDHVRKYTFGIKNNC